MMPFLTSWRIKDRQHFYGPLLQPKSLIFDVGANHGEFTAAFLACGAGRVVAIEPQPDVASVITEAFPLEIKSGRVVVRTNAIGPNQGVAKMYPAKDAGKSMSTLSTLFRDISRANGAKWDDGDAFDVEIVTLDSLIDEFGDPDYIKIDVEGFDLDVLRGLSRPVSLLSFEYNTQDGLIDIAEQCIVHLSTLAQYEFNYQAEAPGQSSLQFQPWVSPEVMRYAMRYDIARAKLFGDIYARRKSSPASTK
jgi:FkbM family methyltransferase